MSGPLLLAVATATPVAQGVHLLAAGDTSAATDPISVLLNGGVLGVVLVLFILRKLVTGGELERVIEERNKAQADLAALRESVDSRALPLLIRATDLLDRVDQRQGGPAP